MVLFSTSPVMRRQTKSFSRCVFASELCEPRRARKSLPPTKGGGAPIGAPSMSAQRRQVYANLRNSSAARQRLLSRAARLSALRRGTRQGERIRRWLSSQFPRFLRPDLAGVTRFDLSRVYRAPRRPVVMPAERWPRAARERFARPFPAVRLRLHHQRLGTSANRHFVGHFVDSVHVLPPLPRSSFAMAASAILSVRAK